MLFRAWLTEGSSQRGSDVVMGSPRRLLLLVVLLMWWSSSLHVTLVMGRSRSRSKLSLWINERQVKNLIGESHFATLGREFQIPIIHQGVVSKFLQEYDLSDTITIPPDVDTVNLTWQAGSDMYTYAFDNFTALDKHLLYQPLLSIPTRGYIPKYPTEFQITIPCRGKEKGKASLLLGLQIFDEWRNPLKGTPIEFRLKKQCVAFVTSSLCKHGCRNGGTCNRHGLCECPQGFKGEICDIALCTPPCQNNGTCISPSHCACPAGYSGAYCQKGRPPRLALSNSHVASACRRPCENGGSCLREGYCWCERGFYGDACEFSRCNPHCQNGGVCEGRNECRCLARYSGPFCENRDDTERPRRSKDPIIRPPRRNQRRKGGRRKSLETRIHKTEQRLLRITLKRGRKWGISKEERRMLRKMKRQTETTSLTLQEKRSLIKLLTRERKHLTSKDKTKLKRFKSLIRQSKRRQKKPRKRRMYV